MYRLDTRDRLGCKRKRKRDCAHEFAVHIDRASAHAGNDPGSCQRAAGKAGEDHVLLGGEVFQNAKQFNVELLNFGPLKDRSADAFHAGPDFVDRHEWTGLGW